MFIYINKTLKNGRKLCNKDTVHVDALYGFIMNLKIGKPGVTSSFIINDLTINTNKISIKIIARSARIDYENTYSLCLYIHRNPINTCKDC